MQLKICATDIRRWFWAATLVFIIGALAGWTPGYYFVMGISAVQAIFFLSRARKKSDCISIADSSCLFP